MYAEQNIRAVALFLCDGIQNMGRWCKDNLVSFPQHRDAEEKVAAKAPTRMAHSKQSPSPPGRSSWEVRRRQSVSIRLFRGIGSHILYLLFACDNIRITLIFGSDVRFFFLMNRRNFKL